MWHWEGTLPNPSVGGGSVPPPKFEIFDLEKFCNDRSRNDRALALGKSDNNNKNNNNNVRSAWRHVSGSKIVIVLRACVCVFCAQWLV